MMIRIIAITGILLCTTIAWMVLGGTLVSRTQASRGGDHDPDDDIDGYEDDTSEEDNLA